VLEELSAFEQTLRDTDATRAAGPHFDRLSSRHGARRPRNWDTEAWRGVLHAAQWSPRGTHGTTHDILENMFRPWSSTCRVTLVSSEGEGKSQIQFHSHIGKAGMGDFVTDVTTTPDSTSFPGDTFTCKHLQRLVRIWYISKEDIKDASSSNPLQQSLSPLGQSVPYTQDVAGNKTYDPLHTVDMLPWRTGLFYTVGPAFGVDGLTSSTTVDLCPVDTSYWEGANWTNKQKVYQPDSAGVVDGFNIAFAQFLSFRYREPSPGPLSLPGKEAGQTIYTTQCGDACEIQIDTDVEAFNVPNAYLMDPGGKDKAEYLPHPPPYGPHIMDPLNIDNENPSPPPNGDPFGTGPHPLYFEPEAGAASETLTALIDPYLAAGVRSPVRLVIWCDDEAIEGVGSYEGK